VTRDELRDLVTASHAQQWSVISGYGPTYFDAFSEIRTGAGIGPGGDGTTIWLEHEAHRPRAVYLADLDVGLVRGMHPTYFTERGTHEDWATRFADPKVYAHVVELLYRGQPVDVDVLASVDGGRYTVPWPKACLSDSMPETTPTFEATRWSYELARLVYELEGGSLIAYEQSVSRCDFTIVD
jgi:hypothetical protein